MIRSFTVGKYIPMDNALDRADPRLKLVLSLAAIVLTFVYSDYRQLIALALILLGIILFYRLPLGKILVSIRSVFVILLITVLFHIFLPVGGDVLVQWSFIEITDLGLKMGIIFAGRILLLVIILSILTLTTPPLRLADGIEYLIKPLEIIRIPVAKITVVISVTLRFVPNIFAQSQKVMRAQSARGAGFDSRNPFKRVAQVIPLVIPLFVKAFRSAEELATAMESRGYGIGGERGRLYPLRWNAVEMICSLSILVLMMSPLLIPPLA